MGAKQEQATESTESCFVMTVSTWKPVVYRQLKVAYMLLEETIRMSGNTLDKTLAEVKVELDKNKVCLIYEMRMGEHTTKPTGFLAKIEQFTFISMEVPE